MLFAKKTEKIIACLLAVISGVSLFAAAAALSIDATLFSSAWHKSMFEKYGLYSQIEKSALKAVKANLDKLGVGSSSDSKQKEQLVSMVKKAVTPEMVRFNTDSAIEGLLRYFTGEARFLPDIYIEQTGKSSRLAMAQTNQTPPYGQSLSGIDRISLSVILMYMDRNDIMDGLSEIRLFVFALSHAPWFLFLLSAVTLLSSLLLSRKRFAVFRLMSLTSGILALGFCLILIVSSKLLLPGYLENSVLAGYISGTSLAGYAGSCILRPALPLAAFGVSFPAVVFLLRLLPESVFKRAAGKTGSLILSSKRPFADSFSRFIKRYVAGLAAVFAVLFLAGAAVYSFEATKADFHAKDLSAALDRLKGGSTYQKVIAARSEIIYSVEVRFADKQTGDPIGGVVVTLDGVLSDKGKKYFEAVPSNESGKARFSAAPGAFRLGFDKARFPQGYNIPASYPFEIRTAGITIITVHLEKIEGPKTGITEMLVLGSGDKPLENLELTAAEVPADNSSNDSASSGKVYSITNKEGTAVFKLTEGRYTLSFMEAGFPMQYLVPDPITIDVAGDTVSTYSLKLSPKPLPTAALKKK